MKKIQVEVVIADHKHQAIIPLQIPSNSRILDAINAANLSFNEQTLFVGIFGKVKTLQHILQNGDRVEVYTPLLIDPKEARTKRVLDERKMQRLQRQARKRDLKV